MTVEYTLLALAVPALLAAAGFAVWTRLRTRRMLDTLGKMLDDAIRGEFRESLYDESRLSALETRMAHYLSASAVSAKNLAEEKDAIKTLIGDISHQTKTPIANLLLYAQLLEEQDLPPESREYVSALEHQAEKLRFLIDALVKTSRLESGVLAMTPKRHGIQQLLDAASAQAAPGAEAKAITLTVEPTDLTARFDPKWTAEALYNLVDNAVKYTPAGGAVTLRAVGYELFCRVDVTDTGAGADADKLNAYLDYQDVDLKVTHGFGIRNVNERLRLRYGEQSCLRYFNYDGKKLLARLKIERE